MMLVFINSLSVVSFLLNFSYGMYRIPCIYDYFSFRKKLEREREREREFLQYDLVNCYFNYLLCIRVSVKMP